MWHVDNVSMEVLNRLVALDITALERVIEWRRKPVLTPVAKTISHSGDGYLQVLVIALAGFSSNAALQLFALTLFKLFVIERTIYLVVKNVSKRERPSTRFSNVVALVNASDRFSFPSGHTAAAFLLATCTLPVMPALGCVFYIWATAVGLSRIFLGVHYPSDILAGVLLGVLLPGLFL